MLTLLMGPLLIFAVVGIGLWMYFAAEDRRAKGQGYRPRLSRARPPAGAAAVEGGQVASAPQEFRCLVCGGDRFQEREALMNTTMATFFNFDWANRSAECLVCRDCGYVHWFLPPETLP